MKNIVFFIQNFSRSAGSEKVTAVTANSLAESGYNVTVLSICGNNTCFYNLDSRIRLKTLISKESVNNRTEFIKVLMLLYKFFKKNKPDICIDVFPSLSLYTISLKKLFGYKNITWEHFNYYANYGMNKLGRQMAIKSSDLIITLTESDKKAYLDNNKRINCDIQVIHNGIDLDVFRIDNDKRNEYRDVLNYLGNDLVIGHVGRFSEEKNHFFIIELFSTLHKNDDRYKLLLIGDGESKKLIESKVADSGLTDCVTFTGNVNNVQNYMQAMDLFILPSKYEGLGIVGIEAQACGLPCVFSTGVPEEAKLTNNVEFVSLEDKEKWIKTIERMIQLPKENNTDKIRAAGYDINQTAEEIRKIYLGE